MSCYHPLYAYKTGIKTETGKDKLRFCTTQTDDYFSDVRQLRKKYGDRLVPIPCGHCLGCALDHSKDWSVRCVLESMLYDDNCFITLTYDEAHCPKKLVKKHFQDFMKRLRSSNPGLVIRFFGCGEYGSKNGRPHYHAILFNFDFKDRTYLCDDGVSKIYRSAELEKLWPFGISSIGEVSLESCSYVARYSNKKLSNSHGDEFLLMSRRPGIGKAWFEDNKDFIYIADKVYGDFGSSHKSNIPRYFDKLAEADGKDLTAIKANRVRLSQMRTDFLSSLHGYEHDEYLNQLVEFLTASKLASCRRYI